MKHCVLGILAIVLSSLPAAADSSPFKHADEQKTWQWILERAAKKQWIEKDRKGNVLWVGFYDEEKKRGNRYAGSVMFDADGHVWRATFNEQKFKNEELARLFKGFPRLKQFTNWHNGLFRGKGKNPYSGEGVAAAKRGVLAHINFGGSSFNDDGLAAAAALPSMRELIVYHTAVTDAGIQRIRNARHITRLRLGPQFSLRVTGAACKDIANMTGLQYLHLNEMWLKWDGELEHLAALKGTLKELELKETQIVPGDLAKLRSALPGTRITHTPPDQKSIERMKRRMARESKK